MEREKPFNSRQTEYPFDSSVLSVGIFAAGESKRFGSCKQMAIYNGETLLGRTIRVAASLTSGIYVITGANSVEIRAAHNQPVKWIHNPEYSEGLGSSMRLFAQYLLENLDPLSQGILILLCDQPGISAQHLKDLYSVFINDPETPALSEFKGITGPPSIFPSTWLEKFSSLKGDRGAKQILRDVKINTCTIPEAAVDIDTPEDYRRLNSEK